MKRVKPVQSRLTIFQNRLYSNAPELGSRIPPFTHSELSRIKSRLSPTLHHDLFHLPPHTVQFTRRPASEAAILIPLMNLDGKPHVLLEVRAANMRSHASEISFPGGKIDPDDVDIAGAALRETWEELGIPPDNVEVLGTLDQPEYSLGNRARVWPVIGFIHDHNPISRPSNAPLPSLPLSSLVKSPDEVAAILPFRLSALHDTRRRSIHHFRVDPRKPYYRFRAEDLVHWPRGSEIDELEVWGLSGWFLNRLAWRLGWVHQPLPEIYEG